MAITVLGLGIPHTARQVPEARQAALKAALDKMDADFAASPYKYEMFFVNDDTPFDVIVKKLREKKPDVVMIGVGLKIIDSLTPFLERIVNTVHQELPDAKFAFAQSLDSAKEAVERVAPV